MIVATNQFINSGQGISAGRMSTARIVEAVYEDGVLKPLQKLNLREGQRVRIRIEESIVDVVRRYREKHGVKLSSESIEKFLAERR